MYQDIEKLIKEKAPIFFTTHALDRIEEIGLNEFYIKSAIYMSVKEKIGTDLKAAKIRRHGPNDLVFFRRYNNLIFTIKIESYAILVITVTNQELTLPPIMPNPNNFNHRY